LLEVVRAQPEENVGKLHQRYCNGRGCYNESLCARRRDCARIDTTCEISSFSARNGATKAKAK
jgi:hypothetical protein